MRALHQKVLRDARTLFAQLLSIALVMAAGVASYLTMQSAYDALLATRDAYYAAQRFGDAFVHLERAPQEILARLEAIPGVARVYTRLVEPALLPLPSMPEPAIVRLISLPKHGVPPLNGVHLERGRWPEAERDDEALLLAAFARRQKLGLGHRLTLVVEGREKEVVIVGWARSPELVFPMIGESLAPDESRFAALWMPERALAAAVDKEGSFDDVVVALQQGASLRPVLEALELVLAPYGARQAIGRELQLSHYVLSGELEQLKAFATVAPMIFLGVAAFLVNVVLSRLVLLERPAIATLKALGYPNWQIGLQFLELVSLTVLVGAIVGSLVGGWLGRAMLGLYAGFFDFPYLYYQLSWRRVLTGAGLCFGVAVIGASVAVRKVVRLPPAEAMRPPTPVSYKPTILERWGLFRLLPPMARMVVRELSRRPLRLLLSAMGIAAAIGTIVAGRFPHDALEALLDVAFRQAMKETMEVTFDEPVPLRAVRALSHYPGVRRAEPLRVVSVRFRKGTRVRDALVFGYPEGAALRRVVDREGRARTIPEEGVLLTRKLAALLDVGLGEEVELLLREGDWPQRRVRVVGLSEEVVGIQGHLSLRFLSGLLREEPRASSALLFVDRTLLDDVRDRLLELPVVASVTRRAALIQHFQDQTGAQLSATVLVLTAFALTLAVGVVYNDARIALATRARDLASLRVLGFTRGEISSVLLGELFAELLLALPLGLVFGRLLANLVASTIEPERFRLHAVVTSTTDAFAILCTFGAGLVSALLVRRKLDRLDLIAALKTRE